MDLFIILVVAMAITFGAGYQSNKGGETYETKKTIIQKEGPKIQGKYYSKNVYPPDWNEDVDDMRESLR